MSTYFNPIKKHGDFADPFILRYNGMYYLYATNPGVLCWTSENLLDWTLVGETVPKDEFPGLVPFAPEVVYWNGEFYMYTSPHGLGHYVLKSNSPLGPFHKITENIGHNIDFSVFIDDDGSWYAYWADANGIVGCEMASPTDFGKPVLLGAYLHGWTEGPFVVKQSGKYYLTYTGNHFLSKGYRINVATAERPLGPYKDCLFNPIIIRTEGDVVGLGHSSTVLGPDLESYYIVYHNLNSDKTRDLNIDSVEFVENRMYVLGPTTTPQDSPQLPDWQCLRYELKNIHNNFMENVTLPKNGIVEINVEADHYCNIYGISFIGKNNFKLEFHKQENMLFIVNDDSERTRKILPPNYNHTALHCIRLDISIKGKIFLDEILLGETRASLAERKILYYSDSDLAVGSITVSSRENKNLLYYPIPGLIPGNGKVGINAPHSGEYQFTVMECSDKFYKLWLDEIELLPKYVDRTNRLVIYRHFLSADRHILEVQSSNESLITVDTYSDNKKELFTVSKIGPFDKVCGMQKYTDVSILSEIEVVDCSANWQAGVLFRASSLADGGEGDNKELGTNFFIGYRVCFAEGKLQLWKHQYDEKLLQETEIKISKRIRLNIVAIANTISVYLNNIKVLSYKDSIPIMSGKVGFHVRNCFISEGRIQCH